MTPRALYGCAALSLLFAILAVGINLGVALALLLAAISFAAAGANRRQMEMKNMGQKTYTIKVVGESFDNPDGTSRQKIIEQCKIGNPVSLVREPNNRYDPNAVGVHVTGRGQIGYVSSENAEWMADVLDKGVEVSGLIKYINQTRGFFGVVTDITIG